MVFIQSQIKLFSLFRQKIDKHKQKRGYREHPLRSYISETIDFRAWLLPIFFCVCWPPFPEVFQIENLRNKVRPITQKQLVFSICMQHVFNPSLLTYSSKLMFSSFHPYFQYSYEIEESVSIPCMYSHLYHMIISKWYFPCINFDHLRFCFHKKHRKVIQKYY